MPVAAYRERLDDLAWQQESLESELSTRSAEFRHESSLNRCARTWKRSNAC
jgi:hypothetical protein